MGWLGGLVGGGIGAMIGGPFGAIFGAAVGASMGGGRPSTQREMGHDEQMQAIFFTAGFSMIGKLSKADGHVSEHEVAAIRKVMDHLQLDEESRAFAFTILKQSKQRPETFEDYAAEFGRTFAHRTDEDLCIFMMEFLFEVAMADGALHSEEARLLDEAHRHFRLSDATYARLKAQYRQGRAHDAASPASLEASYALLGISANAGDAEVKKAWRQKAADFHPDKIQSKGLPPEFMKFANEKLSEINGAYDEIMRSRQ